MKTYSIVAITNQSGQVVEKRLFDAWGLIVKVQDIVGNVLTGLVALDRGYTGHEHLQGVNLIHMNGRLYDPVVHRFLQPDNFIQDAYNTQNFNRYSYVLNNPLKFTDASGEFAWIPVIIGAVIGAYSGGVIANGGQLNPTKWDWNMKTLGYMIGGAIVGGVTGGVSNGIATSGVAFANTKAIIVGSLINGMGTHMYTGGKTNIVLSFGFASLDFTTGEFGYLFKKGNSFMANLGYTLGAIANIQDVLVGLNPGNAQVQTENMTNPTDGKDKIGHFQILSENGDSLIDYGPFDAGTGRYFGFSAGRNNWIDYASNGNLKQTVDLPGNLHTNPIAIKGLNISRLMTISNKLNSNPGSYNFLLNSCSSVASRALAASGYFAIGGIHPYLLRASIYLREIGFRPSIFSHFLNN